MPRKAVTVITPELKSLISVDLGEDELPSDPTNCAVYCEADIGIQGEEGADIFSFTVVTPKRLMKESGVRWGRGSLIVDSFSWRAVENAVEKLLDHCKGETWNEVAAELNKELHWEFENYQE